MPDQERASGNADKTRRAGLTTSQRNKVCPVAAAVVAAPENLGKLEVFPGPVSRERAGGGLSTTTMIRRGGHRWWQYSKLKSMAAALSGVLGGLGAHDQLTEFDL